MTKLARPRSAGPFVALAAVVAVLCCLVPGCATLGGSQQPELPPVQVTSLEPEFTEEGTGRFILGLEVQNPVARVAQVNQVEWEVWLEGRYFAAGTEALEEALGPNERRHLLLTLPVALRRAQLSEPRSIDAAVRGVLLVQRTGFDRALRFEQKFTLARVQVPLPALGRDGD